MSDDSTGAEATEDGASAQTSSNERAAVFIDYQNLHVLLTRQLGGSAHPADYVEVMLKQLRRYLSDQNYTQTTVINAYADFNHLHGDGEALQQSLYMLGAEPHYVPSSVQRNASEMQLCIDAMNVLHSRPDVRSIVLLTGDRPYLPLVQQFKRNGRETFVAALSPPPPDRLSVNDDDFFFDARNLLTSDLRRQLGRSSKQKTSRPPASQTREEATYERIRDPQTLRTLEIIEEYFGQYDEVYLTPLLRKLSELLGESSDPKSIVSRLEAAGAIWLEKRRGTPHDYTVLLVDDEHPEVQEVHDDLYSTSARQAPPQEDEVPSYGDFNESNYAAEYERLSNAASSAASTQASPPDEEADRSQEASA